MCLTCSLTSEALCPRHGNDPSVLPLQSLPTCHVANGDSDDNLPIREVPVRHNSLCAKDHGECSGLTIGPYESKTKILHVINGGSFGHIYLGKNLTTSTLVAIKAEKQGTGSEKLLQEGNVYNKLAGGPGIPQIHWYGMHGSEYNFLIMEVLGPSLERLFQKCNESFSLATVLRLLVDMVEILKFVHGQNIIHRDISPGNFVVARDMSRYKLYLVDYGLAKKCQSAGQMVLSPKSRYGFQFSRPVVGTPRFMSLGIHQGANEGRRDDLESLAYMCIFFLKGSLPWYCRSSDNEKQTFEDIAMLKSSVPISELCSGLPNEFERLVTYTRALKPTDIPDYNGLVRTFGNLASNEGIDLQNLEMDWSQFYNNNTSASS